MVRIKLLDAIIAYLEEITNRGESLDRAAELPRTESDDTRAQLSEPPKTGGMLRQRKVLLSSLRSPSAIEGGDSLMLRLQTNVGTSVVLAVLVSLAPRLDAAGPNSSLPFPRTEVRQPCNNFVATKQPFFGETHLHTAYSFDAVTLDTRNTPKDAYRYAKGEAVGLPPWADTRTGTEPSPPDAPTLVTEHPYCMPGEHCEFMATRTIQFPEGRALDFAAITDHAEQFGESNICEFEATQTCGDDSDCPVAAGQKCISGMCRPEGYDSDTCLSARQEVSRLRSDPIASLFAGLENVPEAVSRPDFCGEDGSICTQQAKLVWDQIQQDAEEAYDRSDACTFTSFVAYEYTAMAVSGRCGTSSSPSADGPPC